MTTPSWPSDGSAVNIPEIVGPLYRGARKMFRRNRQAYGIHYDGFCLPGVFPSVPAQLSADGLATHQAEGRKPLEVVITIAVQLGIEQGRRLERKDRDALLDTCKFALEVIGRQTQFYRSDPVLARLALDIEAAVKRVEGDPAP